MHFSTCAQFIKRIEDVSSRLEITRILAEFFKELSPVELHEAIYLLQGSVSPKYNALNFGVAEKMMIRAVATALQMSTSEVQQFVQQKGDIGEATQELKHSHPSLHQQDLSIHEVFELLTKIATESGEGSQDRKMSMMGDLISCLDPLSARYIVRIPLTQLRLGFSDMTILDALSWMIKGDKSLRPLLQSAYHVRPDLGLLAEILTRDGIDVVSKIAPEVCTPIIMMRAERMSSGDEIIEQIGKCYIEPKYDGFRLQIHKKGQKVTLYTRGLEDATFMYPDIVDGVLKEMTHDDLICEGEAIGYSVQSNSFLPFQETSQRKRKYGIDEKAAEIPLKLFAFDLLYADGTSYIDADYSMRRKILEQSVRHSGYSAKDTIIIAPSTIVDAGKDIELLFDESVTEGLEGIIAKKMTGHYEPGARGWNWIKFKKSYSSKINDTIDCVVMGYDLGKGKRSGFGIGAFLVGVYDEQKDAYVTLAKIGTGLTDDEWREMKSRCDKIVSHALPSNFEVDKMMHCDVWVTPSIVVEIKADEITRSSVHTAGRVMKPSKSGSALDVDVAGYALRFPRLVRFRDDKKVNDATTLAELVSMYK